MKKLILFLIPFLIAAAPARQFTYTSGQTISSTEVTANEDAVFNYLQAGVDTYADNTIVNADVNSAANIQSDKLNLSSLAQDITITSAGSLDVDGSIKLDGSLDVNGSTTFAGVTIADLGTVTTADVNGGTWQGTIDGNWTAASQTCADLGAVTTADINGGTIDGVQVGGTTSTGEILVNDSSDNADGLGSQGTSGQFLKSQGAGSNPTWGDLGMEFVSRTALSNATNSGDISITQGVNYVVFMELQANGATSPNAVVLRFNSDSGSHYGNSTEALTDSTEINLFTIGANSNESGGIARLVMGPLFTDQMIVTGDTTYKDSSNNVQRSEVVGIWNNNDTVTSFEVVGAGALDGEILLYKLGES